MLPATGCHRAPPGGGESKPPEVTVTPAVEREVTDSVEYTGRTEAVAAVEIRARVSGYLEKINFHPGAEVKAGQVLFEIDPKIYQAEYDKADGQVATYQARLDRLTRDVDRNRPLVNKGAVSREDFEKMVGDRDEAIAGLKAAKANLEGARVNLDFTKVKAPIAGKVSRNLITEGNLVRADSTVLANIVSTGRMYVYFDVDEKTLLVYEDLVRKGHLKPGTGDEADAEITLGNGRVLKGGSVDYIDVQLHRGTGTIQVRATFPDPDGILKAGEFVRVRLPVGDPHKAVLIPEVALGSDQGLKYVFVVDDQDKVARRPVELGAVHDGLVEVLKGVRGGEWVIVKGLQRAREGLAVQAKREPAAAPAQK
jgi:RND family efflux transporter MFP subunit